MKYTGSCHCKAVTFEVSLDDQQTLEIEDCNCSICSKSGYLHLIIPLARFTLLTGEDKLTTYRFNSGVAKHTFCSVCGVKPFYTPRSNPDGIDVNLRCLDDPPGNIKVVKFNGDEWEKHAHTLAHKSRE